MAGPERLQKQIAFNIIWAIKVVLIYLWLFINIIVCHRWEIDREKESEHMGLYGTGLMEEW